MKTKKEVKEVTEKPQVVVQDVRFIQRVCEEKSVNRIFYDVCKC